MKIGLLSDTHSHFPEEVFRYFAEVDEIWHAGDIGSLAVTDQLQAFKPLRAVYGNIDDHTIRTEFPENNCFEIDGCRVLITHIAGRPGKYQRNVDTLIRELKPQLLVCGHSHSLLVQMDKQLHTLWVNPGAAGVHGFHKIRTMLRFEINAGKIEKMEAIELGNRSQIHSANN